MGPCMLCRLGLSPGIHSSSQTLQLSDYQLPPVLDLICGLSAHLTGSNGSHAVCRPPAPQQPLELVRLQHFNLQVPSAFVDAPGTQPGLLSRRWHTGAICKSLSLTTLFIEPGCLHWAAICSASPSCPVIDVGDLP